MSTASDELPTTDEVTPETQPTALEQRILELEEQFAQLQDSSLRARAEAENVRKRAQQDIANAHKFALEGFVTNLLAVKDSLEASVNAEATIEALKSGVELTLKQLSSVFDKYHIIEISPEGQKFDPHAHQAISTLPSSQPAQTVINVLQKGYSLNDRVIRPALVVVSSGTDSGAKNDPGNS